MRKQIILLLLAAILFMAYTHEATVQETLESDNLVEKRPFKGTRGYTLHKPLYKLRKAGVKPRFISRKVGRVNKFSVLRGRLYFTVWSRISGGKWIRRKISIKSARGRKLRKLTKGNRKCIFRVKRKAGKLTRVCRKKYSGRVVYRSRRLTKRLARLVKSVAGQKKRFSHYYNQIKKPSVRRLTKGRWAIIKKKKTVYVITRGRTQKRVLRLKKGSRHSIRLAKYFGKAPRGGKIRVRGNGKKLFVTKIRKSGLISRKVVKITKKVRKLLKRTVRKVQVRIPRRGRFVRRGKAWHIYRIKKGGHYKLFRTVHGHKGRRIVATLIGPGLKTAHFRLKGTKLYFKTLTKDGTRLRKVVKVLNRVNLRKIKKVTQKSYARRKRIYKAGKRNVLLRGPRIFRHIWRTVHLRRGRKNRIFAIVKARRGKAALYRYKKSGPHQYRLKKLYGSIHKGVAVKVVGRGKKYKVVRTCGQRRTVKKHRLTPRKRQYIRAIISQRHILIPKKLVIRNSKRRAKVYSVVNHRYKRLATLKGTKRKVVLKRLLGKRHRKVRKATIRRVGRKFKLTIRSKKGKKKVIRKKLTNNLYRGLRGALNYRGRRQLKKLRSGFKFWNKAKRTNLNRLLKKKIVLRRIGKFIIVTHRRGNKIIAQKVKAKSPLGYTLRKSIYKLRRGSYVVVKKARKGLKVNIFKHGGYFDTIRRRLTKKLKRALKAVLRKRKSVSFTHILIKSKRRGYNLYRKQLGRFVLFKKLRSRRNKRVLRKLLGARPRRAHVLQKTHKLVIWGKKKNGRRFKKITKITRKVSRRARKTLFKKRPIKFGLSPGQKTKKAVLNGKVVLRKSGKYIYGSQRRRGKTIIFRIRRKTPFAKAIRKYIGKIPRKGKVTLIGLKKKVKVIRKKTGGKRKVKTIRASRGLRRLLRRLSRKVGYVVGKIRFVRVKKNLYKLYRKNRRGQLKLASVLTGKRAKKFKRFVGRRLKKGVITLRGRKAIIRGRTRRGKYVRKVKTAKKSIIFLGGRKLRLKRHRIRVYKVHTFLYVFVFDSKGNRVYHRIRRASRFGKRFVRAFNLRHYKNVIQGRQKGRRHVVVKAYHGHVWSKKKVRLSKKRARVLRKLFKRRGFFIPRITKFKKGKRYIKLSKKLYGRHRVFKKISRKSAKKHLKFFKGLKRGTIRVVGKHLVVIGKNRLGNVIQKKRPLRRRIVKRLFGRLVRKSYHSKKTRRNLRRKAGIPSRKVKKLLRRIRKLKRRIVKAKRARRKRLLRRLIKKLRLLKLRARGISKVARKLKKLRGKKYGRRYRKSRKARKLRRALKKLRRALRKARKAHKARKIRKLKRAIRRLLKRVKGRKGLKSRRQRKLRRAIRKLRRAIKKARRSHKAKAVRRLKKKLRRILGKLKGKKGLKGRKGRRARKLRRAIKKLRRAIKKARRAHKPKAVRRLKKKLRRLLKKLKRLLRH